MFLWSDPPVLAKDVPWPTRMLPMRFKSEGLPFELFKRSLRALVFESAADF